MYIAVLRTFISKRKQEHEALLAKRMKKASKVLEDPVSNGKSKETPQDEPRGTPKKVSEGGGRGELKPHRVLEALSATGLRAIRYACEVEWLGQVVALDNDKDWSWYILVDDPYGLPSVFLDSAIQSVTDGGMLMCTATDMAVLYGGDGEVPGLSFPMIGSVGVQLGSQISSPIQLQQRNQIYLDERRRASITSFNYMKPNLSTSRQVSTAPTNDPVNIPKKFVSSSSALANSPAFVRPSRTPTSARFGSALNIKTLVAAAESRETPIDETVKDLGPGCIFTLTAIAKWECSSYGRALALHERGTRFDSPHFLIFSLCD
nr:tRNA (guanine(26)-N(2))-dimethyltransferase [Tanacetum cinerariifolium]